MGRGRGQSRQLALKQVLRSEAELLLAASKVKSGLYLSNFIRGVEVLAIEVDDRANAYTYIESRPPLRFFNSSRGVRNFRGGFNPSNPPSNTALGKVCLSP